MAERLELLVERYERAPAAAEPAGRRRPDVTPLPDALPADQLRALRAELQAATAELEQRVAAAEARAAAAEAKADAVAREARKAGRRS
jgi:hypothetical protein